MATRGAQIMSGSAKIVRRIHIAALPNSEGVCMDIENGLLSRETLQSQYPNATGLKYSVNGQWMAVSTNENKFTIPESITNFIVVSDTIDRVRNILNNKNLATQVSNVFGRTENRLSSFVSQHLPNPALRQNLTRRQSRTAFKKMKPPRSKTFKVAFISTTPLPMFCSKENILFEGFLTVTETDAQQDILRKLAEIIRSHSTNSLVLPEEILILTYTCRSLSLPCLAEGQEWSMELLKKNAGQGKLYVMIDEKDDLQSKQSESIQDKETTENSDDLQCKQLESKQDKDANEISDDDFVELGTPTVLMNRRRRRRCLSLKRNSDTEVSTPTPGTSAGIQQTAKTSESNIESDDSKCFIPDVESSDNDMDLQETIQESLRTAESEKHSLQDILQDLYTKVNASSQHEIIVSRRHILDSAFRALRRIYDCSCCLYVKFSGEMGLDQGGPRREFFRLVLQELYTSSLFEGKESSKFFSHDICRLEKKEYHFVGKLVALSVVHECPGLHFIENTLGHLMLGLDPNLLSFNLEKLPNGEAKDILLQLKTIEQQQDVDKFLEDHGDWLMEQGYYGWRMKVEEKEEVYKSLLKQIIFYRTSAEINQFTTGMEAVFGLWTVMKANPQQCLQLLSRQPTTLLKKDLIALFQTIFSEKGSNKRNQEEDTIYCWEVFLQDVEDKVIDVTFEEILVFVSGANQVPPCGFKSKIGIEFYSYEDECKRLPFSSTCSLTLSLPRGISDPDELRQIMIRSLRESLGFGKM